MFSWPALSIHGDKNQMERDFVLKEFRSGRSSILVATDVAARGLDVEDVKFVINFDYPNSSEDYIHRIGRTGRSQTTGTAYAFFTEGNAKHASALVSVLREASQQVHPRLAEIADMATCGLPRSFGGGGGRGGGRGRRGRDTNSWTHAMQQGFNSHHNFNHINFNQPPPPPPTKPYPGY